MVYNGNTSFFLEPLEATSIYLMHVIQRNAFDLWNGNMILDEALFNYRVAVHEIETMIMMHYCAGSKYDTPFWAYAQDRGEQSIRNAMSGDLSFVSAVKKAKDMRGENDQRYYGDYGIWSYPSMYQNIRGLNLNERLWV